MQMRSIAAATVIVGACLCAPSNTQAQWCRMGRDIQDCSFKTEAQCRNAGSGLGVACIEKPASEKKTERRAKKKSAGN